MGEEKGDHQGEPLLRQTGEVQWHLARPQRGPRLEKSDTVPSCLKRPGEGWRLHPLFLFHFLAPEVATQMRLTGNVEAVA